MFHGDWTFRLPTKWMTADVLHTLGYLRAHLKPVESSGGLSGTIKPGKNFELVMPKIMLPETPYSTLAGPDGHYEFRNLPARKCKAAVMLPTYTPKFFDVTVEAGKTATQDAELKSNGNLLRNGGQTVRFLSKDQPDGWFVCLDPKPGEPNALPSGRAGDGRARFVSSRRLSARLGEAGWVVCRLCPGAPLARTAAHD